MSQKQTSTIHSNILMLSMLFPIFTLVDRYLGFANKVLFIILGFLLLIYYFQKKFFRKSEIIYLSIVLISFLISLSMTSFRAFIINPNMAFYYIFLILYYLYIIENKYVIVAEIYKIKKYIKAVIMVHTSALTISMFFPQSYIYIRASGWGLDKYFAAFSQSPNRVGPSSLFIVTLIIYFLILEPKNNIYSVFLIPHLYASIIGGSRTYFVLILCLVVLYAFFWLSPKKLFWPLLIPFAFIVVTIVVTSPMMTKIRISLLYANSGNSYAFWMRFTDYRSILWRERINAFLDFPIFNMLFGRGINYTSDKIGLWSHNDFIEIVCSYGYIGLMNYFIIMILSIKTLSNRKIHWLPLTISYFVWLFNAFFNFFYCYFNSVLSYPILLIFLDIQKELLGDRSN